MAPTVSNIRATAGFRNLRVYELNASYEPIGTETLETMVPYLVSGSTIISGSTVSIPEGTSVSGSVGYYGAQHSGARVLTINDPTPRIISHIGDDGVFAVQVLPPNEVMNGELQIDKTNDVIDAICSNVKAIQVGEANLLLEATDQRGYEPDMCAIAYSAGQDNDPMSSAFGSQMWDFRLFPKAKVFLRESGYGQEANVRQYSFTPMFCTAYPWQVQFTMAIEGALRSQCIRGNSVGKPNMVSFLGDGATKAFPFDSQKPALTAAKITAWKNGVQLSAGYSKSIYGLSFAAAPNSGDVIVVFYES